MEDEARLSRLVTQWSMVRQAHAEPGEVRTTAQRELLERYGGAVRRYLISILRDGDAASDVFQDFSLRFLRGDFRAAQPEYGSFRAFLKTIIRRMVVDYYRARQRVQQHQVALDHDCWGQVPEVTDAELAQDDEVFLQSWRDELLGKAWATLEEEEGRGGPLYFSILRQRAETPELSSSELAVSVSKRLGRELTAGNLRVLVHRARDRFAHILLGHVVHSLGSNEREAVEAELISLRLHAYCKDLLADWDVG